MNEQDGFPSTPHEPAAPDVSELERQRKLLAEQEATLRAQKAQVTQQLRAAGAHSGRALVALKRLGKQIAIKQARLTRIEKDMCTLAADLEELYAEQARIKAGGEPSAKAARAVKRPQEGSAAALLWAAFDAVREHAGGDREAVTWAVVQQLLQTATFENVREASARTQWYSWRRWASLQNEDSAV